MNVFDIVTENKVDEAIPFTKKARMNKQVRKAQKGATKDEMRQMEVELLNYLKTSKQPATVGALQKYFNQKGYGKIAGAIMKQFQTKGQKKAARSQARQDKARAAGQAAAKMGGLAKQAGQAVGSAAKSAAAKAKDLSGVVPASKVGGPAPMFKSSRVTNSMYEAAATDVLTKREVRNIISQVVAKGFGDRAGFDKGRFAEPDKPAAPAAKKAPAGDAQVQKAIDIVKKAGYKVVS